VEKQMNEKYVLSFRLKLIKVGGYDFPTHVMAPEQSPHLTSPQTLNLTCLL
jgi:hypothetical protein